MAATASTRRWVWAVATGACAAALSTGVGRPGGRGRGRRGGREHPRSGAPLRGGGPRGPDRRQSRSRTTVRTRGGRCPQATATSRLPRVPAAGKPTTSSGRKSMSGKRRVVHVHGAARFQAWSPRPSAPDSCNSQQSQGSASASMRHARLGWQADLELGTRSLERTATASSRLRGRAASAFEAGRRRSRRASRSRRSLDGTARPAPPDWLHLRHRRPAPRPVHRHGAQARCKTESSRRESREAHSRRAAETVCR